METTNLEQPTVLVLSANAEFARAVLARWQTERNVPAFALVSSRVWNGAATAAFDLAVVGPVVDAADHLLVRHFRSSASLASEDAASTGFLAT
jgi:hypothetical protein